MSYKLHFFGKRNENIVPFELRLFLSTEPLTQTEWAPLGGIVRQAAKFDIGKDSLGE